MLKSNKEHSNSPLSQDLHDFVHDITVTSFKIQIYNDSCIKTKPRVSLDLYIYCNLFKIYSIARIFISVFVHPSYMVVAKVSSSKDLCLQTINNLSWFDKR